MSNKNITNKTKTLRKLKSQTYLGLKILGKEKFFRFNLNILELKELFS